MQEEELPEFLLLAKDAILAIQHSCESGNEDFPGMLLQAELLIRDIVLLEALEQRETGEAVFDDSILQPEGRKHLIGLVDLRLKSIYFHH